MQVETLQCLKAAGEESEPPEDESIEEGVKDNERKFA